MTAEEIKALLKDVPDKDLDAFIESRGTHVSKDYNDRIRREKAAADEKIADLTTKYEEAVKFKTDSEKEKLKEQGKLQELLDAEKAERAASEKKAAKALADMKAGLIKSEALRVAKEQGIIAEELVDVIDLSKAEYDGGKFAGVVEAIAAHKTAKPHLFREPETDEQRKAREDAERKAKGTLTPPAANGGGGGGGKVDWSKASPEEFNAELARIKGSAGSLSPLG